MVVSISSVFDVSLGHFCVPDFTMFSFVYLVLANRLSGKSVSKMTYVVSSGM